MDRTLQIYNRVKDHLDYLKTSHPEWEIFGIMLQGSQNYNLDIYNETYQSDVDTKAIVIPTLKEIVLNKKLVSTTLILPNNEHIEVKDIRLYFECFKKQNINYIEILFTEFYYIEEGYEDLWQQLQTKREDIAHYNCHQAVKCMAGMAMEKRKALCHPYPTLIDKIEKYGYDGKQLHHIIRIYDFIQNYTREVLDYEHCLIDYPHFAQMYAAKLNYYTLKEAIELADLYVQAIKNIERDYLDGTEREVKKEIEELLYNVQYEAIKRNIIKELRENE